MWGPGNSITLQVNPTGWMGGYNTFCVCHLTISLITFMDIVFYRCVCVYVIGQVIILFHLSCLAVCFLNECPYSIRILWWIFHIQWNECSHFRHWLWEFTWCVMHFERILSSCNVLLTMDKGITMHLRRLQFHLLLDFVFHSILEKELLSCQKKPSCWSG